MHCGRAVREKQNVFSWINFFCRVGSNEVSHAHGRGLEVGLVPQGGRDGRTDGRTDPDRENGHYENIYIDDQSGPPISELKLLVVRIYKVSLADE